MHESHYSWRNKSKLKTSHNSTTVQDIQNLIAQMNFSQNLGPDWSNNLEVHMESMDLILAPGFKAPTIKVGDPVAEG